MSLNAAGGTEIAEAVKKACAIPAPENRLRILTLMTDGYIGNDYEILGLVRQLRGKSWWFPFGTGYGVNRFFIDGIAKEGGGEPCYGLLNSSADEVGKQFYQRISSAVLTDVKVSFDGLDAKNVLPSEVSATAVDQLPVSAVAFILIFFSVLNAGGGVVLALFGLTRLVARTGGGIKLIVAGVGWTLCGICAPLLLYAAIAGYLLWSAGRRLRRANA